MKNKLKILGLSALLMSNVAFAGNNKGDSKIETNPEEKVEITYQAQVENIENKEEGLIRNIELSDKGIKVFEFQNKKDKEIYLETAQGKIINISMNPEGKDENPVINKDGTKVYFSSERINSKGKIQQDIFEANIEDLVKENYQIKLTNISNTKEKSNNPSVSKDGSKLVYENKNNIILADLVKGTKEQLTSEGENYQPNIKDNKVVFAAIKLKNKKSGIVMVDLEDSLRTKQLIVKSSEYDFSNPVLSDDEKKIAYVKDFSKVYVKDLETRKNKGISSTYGTVSAPSWDEKGTFVSYLGTKEDSKGADKIELYVVNVSDLDQIKKSKIFTKKNPSEIVMNKGFTAYEGALSTISATGDVVYSGIESSTIKQYNNDLISKDTAQNIEE